VPVEQGLVALLAQPRPQPHRNDGKSDPAREMTWTSPGNGPWTRQYERVGDVIEFWPEYGRKGPLWTRDGRSVDLASMPISDDLRARLTAWNAAYEDAKTPGDGDGDESG
jgi:hypothetical protein